MNETNEHRSELFDLSKAELVDRVEELERALREEEQEHERTITHRDAAEDTIAQLYYIITGREAIWSNLFGYNDVINEARAVLKEPLK